MRLLTIFLFFSHFAMAHTEGSQKRYNIRIEPLSAIFGVINATFDFPVSETISIGPTGAFYNYSVGSTGVSGTAI
ncbi:MAG: hypothetical protein N2578_06315 [Bdellovibrionaceae bacterium]|nr:hypothetical protein [Pseudobdellovibrionaceae bacterium]